MQETQENTVERQKVDEFSIEYWRERFHQVKPSQKDWMKSLAKYLPSKYDSYEGSRMMLSVANGRAGLKKTAQVVRDLEAMKECKPNQLSTFEKWKKGQLVKK